MHPEVLRLKSQRYHALVIVVAGSDLHNLSESHPSLLLRHGCNKGGECIIDASVISLGRSGLVKTQSATFSRRYIGVSQE